ATESWLSVGEYHALRLKKNRLPKLRPRQPSSRVRRCSTSTVTCLWTIGLTSVTSPWRTSSFSRAFFRPTASASYWTRRRLSFFCLMIIERLYLLILKVAFGGPIVLTDATYRPSACQ
ncbi:hypothetical protein JG688_00016272, partial [Phytophthora aleatoria]